MTHAERLRWLAEHLSISAQMHDALRSGADSLEALDGLRAENARLLKGLTELEVRYAGWHSPSECKALLAGAEALEREQWRPIDTAPKKQTILVFNNRGVHQVAWLTPEDDEDCHFEWWWIDAMKAGVYPLRGNNPTHWRPLPAPPEVSE